MNAETLQRMIEERKARIAVVGLGNVGMPLAARLSQLGYSVTGVDTNPKVVEAVNAGRSPLEDEPGVPELIAHGIKEKSLRAAQKLDPADADVIIICVPLVSKDAKGAFVKQATGILKDLPPGRLIVIETTMPIGTCDLLAKGLTADGRLKLGKDVWIAHAPERIMHGVVLRHMEQLPRIVGGTDASSCELASALYGKIGKVVKVSSASVAEAVKLFEGVYRDVNIAIANELAKVASLHGLPIDEIIAAANTQPWCSILRPGFGVGGHCIPVYPRFVMESSSERGYHSELLDVARKTNDGMAKFAADRLERLLEQKGRKLSESRVALLGLTFKPDTPGPHHATSERLAPLLCAKGAKVIGYDPYIKSGLLYPLEIAESIDKALASADAAVIVVPHSAFNGIDWKKYGIGVVLSVENLFR